MVKFSYIVILASIIAGCRTSNKLINDWIVEEKKITIFKDWEYLLEIDSTLITNKFDRLFPNKLNPGDQISISKEIIRNKDKEYSYYYSDSTLNIRHTDVIFPLIYNCVENELTIYRKLHQGKIVWILRKNER